MQSIAEIVLSLFILVFASFGVGNVYREKSPMYQTSLGFFTILCIMQVIVPGAILMRIDSIVVYFLLILLVVYGFIQGITSFKKIRINVNGILIFMVGFFIIIILAYSYYQQNLGINTFDTVHYLSFVNEVSSASIFGKVDFATGSDMQVFYHAYDFQSFYYLFGMITRIVSELFILISGVPKADIHIYLWVASIVFFYLSYVLIIKSIEAVGIKNKLVSFLLIVLLIGFFGNLYFNKSFAFYGNSFRGLIVGYVMLEIYQMFKRSDISLKKIIKISILMNAAIAVSSSSLFIVALIAYGLCAVLILNKVSKLGLYISIISIPISVNGIVFVSANSPKNYILVLLVAVIWGALWIYDNRLNNTQKDKILSIGKVILYILPFVIGIYSILFLGEYKQSIRSIWAFHSEGDMVWDIFRFDSNTHIIINSLILIGATLYLMLRRKDSFSKVLLFVIVTFYNPINYVFLSKYMASVVYWRSMDIFLNYFSLLLFVSFIFVYLEKYKHINNIIAISLIVIIGEISYRQYNSYYHEMFMTDDNFNGIYKINEDDLDISNALIRYMYYSEASKPTVVSHFKSIKGYVPNIITPMSFNDLRVINQFDGNNDMADELFRIFFPRDYADKDIFVQSTDYTRACEALIEREIDYVILDKEETYLNEDGIYFPLIYEVRDCADNLYENEKYILYRFYWD